MKQLWHSLTVLVMDQFMGSVNRLRSRQFTGTVSKTLASHLLDTGFDSWPDL